MEIAYLRGNFQFTLHNHLLRIRADNTYFYIEQNAQKVGTAPYTLTTTYIDNVTVTGTIPEPVTLGLVVFGGTLCMIRKKR